MTSGSIKAEFQTVDFQGPAEFEAGQRRVGGWESGRKAVGDLGDAWQFELQTSASQGNERIGSL